MSRKAIWTGDTTTHGGTLNDGFSNFTYSNRNKAVLVGHKFWCPKCHCWAEFIEGCSRQTVHGRRRVMEGHRTTCGATAIHTQGIQVTGQCDCGSAVNKTQETGSQAVIKSQQSGDYAHTFSINNNSGNPIKYLIFNENTLLAMGTTALNTHGGNTVRNVKTEDRENIKIAFQAPRPLIK